MLKLALAQEGMTGSLTEGGSALLTELGEKSPSEIFLAFKTWLVEFVSTTGVNLILAAMIVIVGFKLIKLLSKKLKSSRAVTRLDPSMQTFISSSVNIIAKLLLLLTAAAIIGIPMASVVAVVGSAGLALGLALQGSLSNIAGGFIIMVFKPFSVGDFITAGSHTGTVVDIGIFYTKLHTPDDSIIVLPNSSISNQDIVNISSTPTRCVALEFTAAYDSDIEKVKEVLLKTALAHPLVVEEPSALARLNRQDDSALSFILKAWCKNDDYWTVYFDLNEQVKLAFDKNGIEIPYPQIDIHTK